MKFSQRWWVIVALLFASTTTGGFLAAQTEEPSAVNAPSSEEVQSNSEARSSSDEPGQKQSTLVPNRDTALAKVKIEILNELRCELLDDRTKTLDWWLAITAIFLTFLAIIIPIIALIGGIFSFKRFNEIKDEAQRYVEEIKAKRDEADSSLKGMSAEVAGDNPDKASEVVENIQQNPDSTLINQAVAVAISLQQQSKVEEAIEKWRSIANIAEGTDNELAARAWFSVGYLTSPKNTPGEDFEEAVKAYDKAIELGPFEAVAYFNRGNAKASLGQTKAAIDDYNAAIGLDASYTVAYLNRGNEKVRLGDIDEAREDFKMVLNLAQAAGIVDLAAYAKRVLEDLDKDNTP